MKKTLLILTLSIVSFSSYSANYENKNITVNTFSLNSKIFSKNDYNYAWLSDDLIVKYRNDGTIQNNYYNSNFKFGKDTDISTKKLININQYSKFKTFQNVINSMSGLTDSEFNTFYASNFLDYNHNYIPDIYETDMILSNDIIFYLKNIIMFICFGIGFSIGALFLRGLL